MKNMNSCSRFLIHICLTSSVAFCRGFNNQVRGRVQDNLDSFFDYVIKASKVPEIIVSTGSVNVSDPFSAGPKVLFPSVKANSEYLPTWFYGLETGFVVMYYSRIPSAATTLSNGPGKIPQWVEYKFDSRTGNFENKTGNTELYDLKSRSWYRECKNANKTIWASPFFTFGSLEPAVAIVHPIFNLTIHDHKYTGFAGALAVETSLQGISDYLYKYFHDSNTEIFIVDMNNLYLMGSSWNTPLSYNIGSSKHYIRANESADPIISSVTSKLISYNWKQELLVLGENYVQCQIYETDIPGITWYVVVIMPASVDSDHIVPGSPISGAVAAFSTVAILFITLSGIAVLYFFKTRLFKLTRPAFTITILIGGLSLGVYCLLLIGSNTETTCAIRPWLFNLSFTFAFAPLLIKSWRVHVMFNLNPYSKKKLISTELLLSFILPLVLIDALILGLTLYVGGEGTEPFTKIYALQNGANAELTYCRYVTNYLFFTTEIAFKGLLILIACVLSILIRKINGAVAGSKALIIIIYNIAFISGIVLLMGDLMARVETQLLIQVVGICYCVIVTAVVLVFPTVYELVTIGDEAATAEVLEDLFEKSRSPKPRLHQESSTSKGRWSVNGSKNRLSKVLASPVEVKPIPEAQNEQCDNSLACQSGCG